jgi:hypothetical protein
MTDWWVRQGGSAPIGPVSTELVIRGIDAGKVSNEAEVCPVGGREWLPIDMVSEFIGYTFDDEAATRVVDSPWFESEAARSMRLPPQSARVAPPPPPQRHTAPLASSRVAVPNSAPTRVAPPPPPSRAPISLPRSSAPVAALPYDESDDAATRVASPMSEVSPRSYAFDDETMTRVATGRSSAAPAAPRAGPGVLPTLPMRELEDMQEKLRPVTAPRPAAGAPPPPSGPRLDPDDEPSIQVNPALQVPAGSFPRTPLTEEYQAVEPTVADRPPYPAPLPPTQGFQQYPPPPPSYTNEPDQGLRALVALIVFLAVALAIVLVLLFIRR